MVLNDLNTLLNHPPLSCACRGNTELGDVTPHNIKQLKRLNQVVFPVTYNDKFYKDVLEVGELAKLGKVRSLLSPFIRFCFLLSLLLGL